ncbi:MULTISPECIES: phytanoyl-CoA dioxygenase family protein [unclassified Iodidimonas]|jgi:hypothetical protein|uniref:phytanoyl-CoA dioxygenase family protein n=1 Tax=unclassified Iodidimonas TaxID=2626145 RepID=UPI002482F7F1|nr:MULTISPECIES: phytanoyl-CoA dioxygenase family protein [unclassified Iodidimonas]
MTALPNSLMSEAQDNSALIKKLCKDGYVICNNLMAQTTLKRLRTELEPWFLQTPRCEGYFYGYQTTRFGRLLTKTPAIQPLITHPFIKDLNEQILGPHCDYYQLNLTQAVRIHANAPQQPPHRDEDMWPTPHKAHEFLINVLWAIDDFTAENGATRLWPGSHRQDGKLHDPDASQMPEIMEMPAGSALIFLGSTLHAGGANIARTHRTGIIVSYSLGWLKSYENQFLAYPPEEARHLPKELQDLIGYRLHRPNLGGYENHCPSVLLQSSGRPASLPARDALPPEIDALLKEAYENV